MDDRWLDGSVGGEHGVINGQSSLERRRIFGIPSESAKEGGVGMSVGLLAPFFHLVEEPQRQHSVRMSPNITNDRSAVVLTDLQSTHLVVGLDGSRSATFEHVVVDQMIPADRVSLLAPGP